MAIRPIAALALAVLVAAMVTSSVLARAHMTSVQPAAVVHRPDGLVQFQSYCSDTCDPQGKPLLGNNIYNTTGINQTAKAKWYHTSLGFGSIYVFGVTVQNDGSTSDRFKVKATGPAGWSFKYFRGTTNITSAVVAGNYQTPSIAQGASYVITVKAYLDSQTTDTASRVLTISSVGDPTKKDAVKVLLKLATCGC